MIKWNQMVMVTDAAVPANRKNDTRSYSDTYVKRILNWFAYLIHEFIFLFFWAFRVIKSKNQMIYSKSFSERKSVVILKWSEITLAREERKTFYLEIHNFFSFIANFLSRYNAYQIGKKDTVPNCEMRALCTIRDIFLIFYDKHIL